MTTLLLATMMSFLPLSGANSEGHPDAYLWSVTTPSWGVQDYTGENISVPMSEDGLWLIELDAIYLHQSPFGPFPWTAHVSVEFSTIVFNDGFEDGTSDAWN